MITNIIIFFTYIGSFLISITGFGIRNDLPISDISAIAQQTITITHPLQTEQEEPPPSVKNISTPIETPPIPAAAVKVSHSETLPNNLPIETPPSKEEVLISKVPDHEVELKPEPENIKTIVQRIKALMAEKYPEEKTEEVSIETEIYPPQEIADIRTSSSTFPNEESNLFTYINARVSKVVDGDTVDITDDEDKTQRVRIIGIDTPETKHPRKPVQCFGPEASQKAYTLLYDKQVRLALPKGNSQDKYKRLLAYIEIEPQRSDYGSIMIEEGYAFHYDRFPHDRLDRYESLEITARESAQGLWNGKTCNGMTTSTSKEYTSKNSKPTAETSFSEIVTITDCSCTENTKNCSHFKTHAKAQAYFECCMEKVNYDIHKLDRDGNNLACESL